MKRGGGGDGGVGGGGGQTTDDAQYTQGIDKFLSIPRE